MHKQINFDQERDFPTTKDYYSFIQEALRDMIGAIMASGCGANDYIILQGVEEDGANHTNGWVVIEGELLPFVGAATSANIIITEAIVQAPWKDVGGATVNRDTYYTRTVSFGVGVGQIPFANFKRLELARTRQMLTGGSAYLGNANNPFGTCWSSTGFKTLIFKDQFNRTHIQGIMQYNEASPTLPNLIATLEEGFRMTRPSASDWYGEIINISDGSKGFIKIDATTGEITVLMGELIDTDWYFINANYITE